MTLHDTAYTGNTPGRRAGALYRELCSEGIYPDLAGEIVRDSAARLVVEDGIRILTPKAPE